jgi:hypothetical protein
MNIVYTVVTGNYCPLNPNNAYIDGFRYVCFTDGQCQVPDPWEVINLLDYNICKNISDPKILSRVPKILSHLFFNDDDVTIHFDARQCINTDFMIRSINSINDNIKWISWLHPWRITFSDEVVWYYYNGLIMKHEVINEVNRLKTENYNFTSHICTECGFIVRKQSTETKELENIWWDEYTNFQCYAKRDQLPFGVALQKTSYIDSINFIPKEEYAFNEKYTMGYNSSHGTSHPTLRPTNKETAEIQSFVVAETQVPLLAPLINSKPLSV